MMDAVLQQGMFDWVDILESKLDSMPPVGTDVDTVKQQLADLKVKCPPCLLEALSAAYILALIRFPPNVEDKTALLNACLC